AQVSDIRPAAQVSDIRPTAQVSDIRPTEPPITQQTQFPQAPQEPQLVERQPEERRTFTPHFVSPQKKPTNWILPLAGVFAALGTVLLAAAGVQRLCCRGGAATRRERPGAVVPLRSRAGSRDSDNTRRHVPLVESEDQQEMEDDIVSIFEGQVKEARQRAKSLTRKSRPASIDVTRPPSSPSKARPAQAFYN
ncbi:unnamed protein product, partial [Prorocentrum cordatum]